MKKIIGFSCVVFGLCYSASSMAFVEKQIDVFSPSMNKKVPTTVVLPNGYSEDKKYSVIYTLHGWSGNHRNYPEKTALGELADKYHVIYVSTDGNYDSWFVDSEVKPDSKYHTFIAKELVPYIDQNYATIAAKEHRAITGLSMGGFGALYIGVNNQDLFGYIGSMSGGVIPQQYQHNWGISAVINKNWENYNITDLAHRFIFSKTQIIIDCGIDDFFIEPNRALHKKLLDLNVKHTYIEKPGSHTWDYWRESIHQHTFFFTEHFNKQEVKK